MESEPKRVRVEVVAQGAVRVNGDGWIHAEADNIVCIYVDLATKYAEVCMVGGSDVDPPDVYLAANKRTIKVDESVARTELTRIEFPDYVGWDIFGGAEVARYTLAVTLVKRQREDAPAAS